MTKRYDDNDDLDLVDDEEEDTDDFGDKLDRAGKVASKLAKNVRMVNDVISGSDKRTGRRSADRGATTDRRHSQGRRSSDYDYEDDDQQSRPTPAKEQPKKAINPHLLWVSVVLVVVAFGVTMFVYTPSQSQKPHHHQEEVVVPPSQSLPGMYALDKIVTNPRGETKLVEMEIWLSYRNSNDKAMLEENKIKLQEAAVLGVRELTVDQIGSDFIPSFKKKLQMTVNDIIGQTVVMNVYVTSVVYK